LSGSFRSDSLRVSRKRKICLAAMQKNGSSILFEKYCIASHCFISYHCNWFIQNFRTSKRVLIQLPFVNCTASEVPEWHEGHLYL
jgi:hypothetical protein